MEKEERSFSDQEAQSIDKEKTRSSSSVLNGNALQSRWRRILTMPTKEGNETKRAMQSRHLMMIGEHILMLGYWCVNGW